MADDEGELAPRMSNADQIVGSEMCTCPDGTCEWCEAVLPDDSPARAVDFSEWVELGYVDEGGFNFLVDPDKPAYEYMHTEQPVIVKYDFEVSEEFRQVIEELLGEPTREELRYIRDYGEPTGRVDPELAAKLAEALEGCERCQGVGECGWCK